MAKVLALVDDSGTVANLITGNLRVRVDGWQTASLPAAGDPVYDTLGLVGRAASDAALGSAIYDIQGFVSKARRNANNVSWEERCWLYWKPDDEQTLRSLVVDGELMLEATPGQGGLGPLLDNQGFVHATLALQHLPWWEGTAVTAYNGTALSFGGDGRFPTTITRGDLSGRIYKMNINGLANTADLQDMWVGLRPNYAGTPPTSNFTWEYEYGTMATGGSATLVADAGAFNGTAVRVDFSGTAAMIQRMRISVSQGIVGTALDLMAGRYLVLSRQKCGASTECLVDLYHGLGQIGSSPTGIELVGETKVTNTDYEFIELGQVQIPPHGIKIYDGDSTVAYSDTNLYIYAQRLTGSSYLYLDRLVLIPCEHMVSIKNAGVNNITDALYYRCGADGKSVVYAYDTTSEKNEIVEHTMIDFTFPPDGAVMVVAAQGSSPDLTAQIDVELYVYPRYSLIRV